MHFYIVRLSLIICVFHAYRIVSILFQLIKRIITLNKCHADVLASQKGSNLIQTIKMVHDSAEKIADASAASLATEILKLTIQE